MDGDLISEMAVSVGGIAILVAVAWLLGATRSASVEPEAAVDRLTFDEPDFSPRDWFWSEDRKSAAAISADGGELALVFALGDGLATRRLKSTGVRASVSGADVLFEIGEPSLTRLRVRAKDEAEAREWLSKITAGGVR